MRDSMGAASGSSFTRDVNMNKSGYDSFVGFSEKLEEYVAIKAERSYSELWQKQDFASAAEVALEMRDLYSRGDGKYEYWDLKAKEARIAAQGEGPFLFLEIKR
ncbi:MAG: hypothetical protein ACP5K9_03150 [Candidatus Micrarchaeia archaeon]